MLSGASFVFSLEDKTNKTVDPIPTIGVCVSYDIDTVGTMVTSPIISNGVVSCESGQFFSVVPQSPQKVN